MEMIDANKLYAIANGICDDDDTCALYTKHEAIFLAAKEQAAAGEYRYSMLVSPSDYNEIKIVSERLGFDFSFRNSYKDTFGVVILIVVEIAWVL